MLIDKSSLSTRETSWRDYNPRSHSIEFSHLDPREMMRRKLPKWIQPLLTNLVAKPYIGEKPRQLKVLDDLGITFVALGSGVAISYFAISQSGLYLGLFLFSWVLTVYGSRKLRLTIMHACSHRWVFANNRELNDLLGELISILTLTRRFKVYQRGHNHTHHHRHKLLNPGDETYEYLINTVGFRLGMTVDEAWGHLWATLLSPSFYIRQFSSRISATFLSSSWNHNLFSFAFWSSILTAVTLTNSWLAFLVSWLIPISIFFEASSLLRQCVEHRFPVQTGVDRTQKEVNQMTAAIFCGEATPQLEFSASWVKRYYAWTIWWLRMLFYHLPSRLLILTGDSAGAHDLHHRHPGFCDWINAIYERQRRVETGDEEYYQSWGLLNAINETFISLSLQAPVEKDFRGSSTTSITE